MILVNYIPTIKMCQLIGNPEEFDLIRNKFSVFNEASKYSKSAYTPNRLYAITSSGLFRPGLISCIKEFAEKNNISFNIHDEVIKITEDCEKIPLHKFELYDYYDFQEECLNNLLKKQGGLCVVGTGGGKTLIAAGLINSISRKTHANFRCLMVVDSTSMVKQTIDRFKEYGVSFTIGPWDSKNNDKIEYDCTVINTQLITSKSKNKDNAKILLKLFDNADLYIFDEVHHVKNGNKIAKFTDKLNINRKYGFTGTLPPNQMDKWLLNGIFGDVVYEKPSIELRKEGKLTNTEIKIFKIHYKSPPKFGFTIETDDNGNEYIKDPTEAYDKEHDWLFENKWRNDFMNKICRNFNNNILLLVNSLKHLDCVYENIKDIKNKQIFIIKGEITVENRDKIFKLMEIQDNVIVIAMSTIFSTGIDVSNIHMVLFAAPGKSFIRTVQSIGRGIRLRQDKHKLLIVDIADDLKYGRMHMEERKETYKSEQFPYHIFNVFEK